MIMWLIIHIKLLVSFILKLPKILFLGIKTLIKRIREKYYKVPHFKHSIGIYGRFGSGKGVYTINKVRGIIKRYSHCNYRILTNMTFNMEEFKKLGMKPENYRFFTNVDDIDWLMETKIDEKTGKEMPAFDFGICIIDEINVICNNRDFMNSKKGKGVITKNFNALLHQLRKRNVLLITQFQDDSMDITFRRLYDYIYCPHMHFFDRFNLVKVYNPKALFAYLDDPTMPVPEPTNKFLFVCTDAVFRSYDTHQLVKAIAEGDYYSANSPDLPISTSAPAVVSHQQERRGLIRRALGNKSV